MKKSLFICFCIAIAGLMFNSCGPDDIKVQGEVKQILLVEAPTVTSVVRNGITTLSGTVDSEELKTSLEAKVSEVNGVKNVINEINVVVPAPEPSADETLQKVVSVAMSEAGFTDVTVEVKDEVITLSGAVKKADQKKVLAVANNFQSKGVVNNLK